MYLYTVYTIQTEKEEFITTIETLKADISKNDALFKRTLETERTKMKQELQNRTNRVRSLGKNMQQYQYSSGISIVVVAVYI